MPFLRYSTGDLVTPGPSRCPCGAPVRTLARIDGRVVDRFALPAGGFVHPYQISLPVRQTPWVRRFRMIQQPSLDLHIDLVPMPGFQPPEPELFRLRKAIASAAPPSLSFQLQLLPELPLTPGGKFKQFTASP
jgi:phenylacetate-coenzyme A ligase PaaK-like adenylate-forming protein